MPDHPILFLPGPTEVDAELREIMAMPLIGHRSAGFVEEVRAVREKLRPLFLTAARTFFENCPATALMEAAVRNLVERRILHLTCGAFSERWWKVSRACGREAHELSVEWGEAIQPEALRDRLRTDPPYEAVAITHNETSTGVILPLRELARVVREESPDTLILVDTVTSLGGAELRFDEWGLDLAFAGTQKCLALPPGLCVWAVSERAMERAAGIPHRGWLLDFLRADEGLAQGKTVATPCVPLVFALSRQLDRIAAEGLETRWRRHLAMRDEVVTWAAGAGLSMFVAEPWRSPTVSTIRPGALDLDELVRRATEHGFTVGKGYGRLKQETFRIGHMGDHTLARLRSLLSALV